MPAVRYAATFATRFALAGGSLPVLAKILGHADLSFLMRYVHPPQADMDRAMEWYSKVHTPGPELEKLLLEYEDGSIRGVAQATFWATQAGKSGPCWPNSAKFGAPTDLVIVLDSPIRFNGLRVEIWYAR